MKSSCPLTIWKQVLSSVISLPAPSLASNTDKVCIPGLTTTREVCPRCSASLTMVLQRRPVRCITMAEPQCLVKHHFAKQCTPCNTEHGVCKFWCGSTETIVPADFAETTKTVDIGSPATPIFMLNKSFGIHENCAHRWAYRLFANRASCQEKRKSRMP